MAASKKKKVATAPTKASSTASIGIIGGSGLYSMSGLTDVREIRVKTPFGGPSDAPDFAERD
jgi:purine nucleoside phosphorylase